MGKKASQNDFEEKAKKAHPEYDFSKSLYVNIDTKVIVGCPIHGDFQITPYHLIKRKQGCPRCKPHKLIQDDFIERCKQILPQYDYSKAVYINAHEKVCLICSVHGEFFKFPPELYKGHGCPKCQEDKQRNKRLGAISQKICSKCGYKWNYKIGANTEREILCPVCTNRVLWKGHNDFATIHPELLKEWDFKRNSPLSPDSITSGYSKKVWWFCEKGHSYQNSVSDKIRRNPKCPICSGRILQEGENDLKTLYPEILKEWDYNKNREIKPNELSFKSTKKVWWRCKNKHSWYASVYECVWHDKTGCPVCKGKKVFSGENDLKTINPRLAKEFHPTKNGKLTPSTIIAHSNKKIWWICPKGHEYESVVSKRMDGQNCPICSNKKVLVGYNDLETKYPELAAEWDYKQNKQITPKDIVFGSTKKFWWICSKCGKNFQSRPTERVNRNSGCPDCAKLKGVQTRINTLTGRRSLSENKELIKDFDYEANYPKTPDDFTPKSNRDVFWKCHKCGYQWKTKVISKANTNGCPACSNQVVVAGRNDLATTSPEVAKEWHPTKNGALQPTQVTRGSGKKVWWVCPVGHEYQATILQRNGGYGTGCPVCFARRQTSFAEQAIYYYVKKVFPDAVNRYKAPFLGRMELDIYIPSIKWAIEYDGKAWHNSATLEREKRKYEICKKNGIRLYRLKEEKQTDKEFGTFDRAMHTDDMWTPKKLNATIYNLLIDLHFGFFNENLIIDIEKDRFEILDNMLVKVEDSIVTKYPDLVKEWDYEKNGRLKPDKVTYGMQTKIWWKCSECGNSFKASISHRCNGTGCPICGRKKCDRARMRKVACISLETGETLKIYDSIKDACEAHGMKSEANITSVCRGARPKAGGYSWRYIE